MSLTGCRYFFILVRSLHSSASCCQVKKVFPVKTPSMQISAKKLGFKNAKEMYPKYPLEEPPKLWMIQQMHTLKGRPYWEKETMKELGLHEIEDICIQVNGPHMNEILWSIKHLIKIQPVRFPQGIPEESDIGYTQLKKNGEFIIYKKLKPEAVKEEDKIPKPAEEDWKVVDGYRMCRNCNHRRCLRFGMCQKLWFQRGNNYIERLGPRMFNYVDNPLKKKLNESETSQK